MNDYRVGQVLYMIGDKAARVLPIQVVEEIVRTTMDGKVRSYVVRLPDKAKTTADISELKGQLFETTASLREHMLSNATNAIDKMINHASSLRDSVFEYVVQDANRGLVLTDESLRSTDPNQLSMFPSVDVPSIGSQGVQPFEAQDIIKVDLGDGKFATMKTQDFEKVNTK